MNAEIVHLHETPGFPRPREAAGLEPAATHLDYTVLLGWLEACLLEPEEMSRRVRRFREAARCFSPALCHAAATGDDSGFHAAAGQLGEAARALSAHALAALCREAARLAPGDLERAAAAPILRAIEAAVKEIRDALAEIAEGAEGGNCAFTE